MGKSFKDLDVWKHGRQLRIEFSTLVKTFPSDEKYRLVDQMVRASRSVTANIAEGYGRFHYQENVQYCRHSRGSLTELQDHLSVAIDEGFITSKQEEELNDKIEECTRILNGYINFLLKSKKTNP